MYEFAQPKDYSILIRMVFYGACLIKKKIKRKNKCKKQIRIAYNSS